MESNLKKKYISRLGKLIEIGKELPELSKQIALRDYSGGKRYRTHHYVSTDEFTQWKINCLSLLDIIVPKTSIHRSSVDKFLGLTNSPESKKFGVSFLKAIMQDFEEGFLEKIEYKIDAELNADFLIQAESLIQNGISDKSYIPAAVIAGAVLEHGLRSIYLSLDPLESEEENNKKIMLGAMIDLLKKRGLYNELTAKQLRSFADIRNAAAHGNFNEFTPEQAKQMVDGVASFLEKYSPS